MICSTAATRSSISPTFLAKHVPSERSLSRTFQLTAAEARLASSLAAGEGIDAASARLAIGRETARTQLRAIFAKTGTRGQTELTALLSPFPCANSLSGCLHPI